MRGDGHSKRQLLYTRQHEAVSRAMLEADGLISSIKNDDQRGASRTKHSTRDAAQRQGSDVLYSADVLRRHELAQLVI